MEKGLDGSLGDDHPSPGQTKDGQTEASGGNSKLGGCDNGTLAQTTHQVILDEPGFLIWKLHLAIMPAPGQPFPQLSVWWFTRGLTKVCTGSFSSVVPNASILIN